MLVCVAFTGSLAGLLIFTLLFRKTGARQPVKVITTSIADGTLNLIPTLVATASSPLLFKAMTIPYQVSLLATFLLCTAISIGNGLFFLTTLANRTTPYWGREVKGARGKKPYDVFISYKAEDAGIARQLADWLLALGCRPWFDEYVIPHIHRNELESSIESGALQCSVGIVMANAEYAKSHFTRLELRSLVHKLQPSHLFNLYSGEWPTLFPSEDEQLGDKLLELSNRAQYQGSLEPVCTWLRQRLNIDHRAQPLNNGQEEHWFALGENWEINLGPWKHRQTVLPGQVMWYPGRDTVFNERSDYFDVTFQGRKADLNVIRGIAPESWRRDFGKGQIVEKRALQMQMKQVLAEHLAETTDASRFEGAHLIYVDSFPHLPQIGFTYWNQRWSRRFSIVLPTPGGLPEELAFVFSVEGSFEDLCLASSYIEPLASSVRTRH